MSRVVVVGAGLSGLLSAILLRRGGHQVTVVTKGLGGLQLSQGTIDVLGRVDGQLVTDPYAAMADLPAHHPYHRIGAAAVREGVAALVELLGPDLLLEPGDTNVVQPTAVGAWRPTLAVPPSMAAGTVRAGARGAGSAVLSADTPVVVVGIAQVKDFHAHLVAGNLSRTPLPDGARLTVRHASIDLGARPGEVDSNPVVYARALDLPESREKFVQAVRAVVREGEVVALPAVLGLNDPKAWADMQAAIGAPVFEIALQPPSVPGMRLNQALVARVKKERARWMLGASVTGLETSDAPEVAAGESGTGASSTRVTGVIVHTAGGDRTVACDHVVHAPGGFESGALAVDSHNHITETVFGLPLTATDATDLIHGDYWGSPQPLFEVGVAVDDEMRVLDADGRAVYSNLHATGGLLAGAIRWTEKSGEGIAVGSAVKAAAAIGAAREGATWSFVPASTAPRRAQRASASESGDQQGVQQHDQQSVQQHDERQ